jgi:hypothetical protein
MYTRRLYGLEIKLPVFRISAAVRDSFLDLCPDSYTVGTRALTSKWLRGLCYSRACSEPREKQIKPILALTEIEVLSSKPHITLLVERTRYAVCWKAQRFACDCVELNALGNILEGVVRGSAD